MGTALFQQLTGVEAAVYYTPEVLKAAGLENEASDNSVNDPPSIVLLLNRAGTDGVHQPPHGGGWSTLSASVRVGSDPTYLHQSMLTCDILKL